MSHESRLVSLDSVFGTFEYLSDLGLACFFPYHVALSPSRPLPLSIMSLSLLSQGLGRVFLRHLRRTRLLLHVRTCTTHIHCSVFLGCICMYVYHTLRRTHTCYRAENASADANPADIASALPVTVTVTVTDCVPMLDGFNHTIGDSENATIRRTSISTVFRYHH